jgi:transposase
MTPVMGKRDARSLDHATLEELRRLAVRRVVEGATQVAVARSVAVHRCTVAKWMRTYRRHGDRALAARKASGRPPTLTPRQQQRLRRLIIKHDPRQLDFPFALWTLPLVAELVEREFGVVLHKTTIARLLHRLDLTPQQPRRRAIGRDDAVCRRWAQDDFPALVRAVRRRQATLLFADEAGVHEDGPLARTWGARGQRPVVRVTGTRARVNVISAISPRGRLWFRCFTGTLTAPRFIEFLTALLQDVRGTLDVVLDKHPAHVAAATRRFLQQHRTRIRVHFLPSYAPDLNPDEHVWSYLKALFRKEPLVPGERLRGAVEEAMEEIRADRGLVRRFFGHPDVAYVKEALHW